MILVVGLGNVGKKYQNTRHNVGFIVVDYLSDHYKFSWNKKAKFNAEIAEGCVGSYKLLLVKPITCMNLSGIAVKSICSYYKIKLENTYIIHDDIDLITGRIKCKLGGSSGGHNGINSIDQYLGNNYYYRIRIGVGRPNINMEIADYILGCFSQQEYELVITSISIIVNNFDLLLAGELDSFKKRIVYEKLHYLT